MKIETEFVIETCKFILNLWYEHFRKRKDEREWITIVIIAF